MKDLSFVKDTGTGENLERDFWSVSPSGDYAHECFTGELYAYELINHIKKENFKPLLGWVIFAMQEKVGHSGIEVGFFSVFAEIALSKA